ncbi:MAG TPA: DUF1772 domain-containing protein [Fimbriiglobus sp.]|nr:DUF1772 domain-containing protein [Fimbriiglobus sp.]
MSALVPALFGLALLPYAAFFGIAVYLFIAPCYNKLSGRAFTEFFQAIDPYMRVRAPLLGLAQVALTLPLLGLLANQRAAWPFGLTLAALLAAVVGMAIAIKGNVPLNRQLIRWLPPDLPADWEQVRDRWLRLHSLRGAVESVGFVLLLAAALSDSQPWHPGRTPIDWPADAAVEPAPRRLEATVYLPLTDNEGQPFTETTWHEALERLVAPFGGATLGEPQEGCWLDARGRMCRERVRPVVVSFAPERLGEFRRAVHGVGQRLGQEVVYVRFEEPRVDLIPVGTAGLGIHDRSRMGVESSRHLGNRTPPITA